jgi:hypothetical protein
VITSLSFGRHVSVTLQARCCNIPDESRTRQRSSQDEPSQMGLVEAGVEAMAGLLSIDSLEQKR